MYEDALGQSEHWYTRVRRDRDTRGGWVDFAGNDNDTDRACFERGQRERMYAAFITWCVAFLKFVLD